MGRGLVLAAVLLVPPVVVLGFDAGSPGAEPTAVDLGPGPQAVDGVPGIDQLFQDGRVLVGSQPSPEALARLKELGVTGVVNLRTSREMVNPKVVAFDEVEEVHRLGLAYLQVQLGGKDHPYRAEAVDRFAEFLDGQPGLVLVHCGVAWRASYLWVAYLVRHRGTSLEQAMARGEAMAISPNPLEGLLGRPVTLVLDPAPGEPTDG